MNLRKWIKKYGMSITDFAHLIGFDRSYVHMWMNGSRKPGKRAKNSIWDATLGEVDPSKEVSD